ncbi:MAG: hypothetical protein ACI8ZB_003129 [Desulforhopalus sp.]|jgi:hypothetical protein
MPSKTTEEKENKVVEIKLDPNLKAVWVDNIHMANRDDGISCIRLSANLPEGLSEQSRFMTNVKSLKEFVEVICSTINYYPTKKTTKTVKPSRKPKPVE